MTTQRGFYRQDLSGLWHYTYAGLGHISGACEDALRQAPPGPAWFWFNDTPAPILSGDTPGTLHERWFDWRADYQSGKLLKRLLAFSLGG